MAQVRRRYRRWFIPLTGLGLAAALAIGANQAFAFWASSGSGSGTAKVGTLAVTVTALTDTDRNPTSLIPGGQADALVRVHNPNNSDVTITDVRGAGDVRASNGCTPTGVTFVEQHGLSTVIPAGATALVQLHDAVRMSLESAGACQGATFAVPVTVTVRS